MATDTILTTAMITNESLMVLENSLPFASQVLRTYDDSFGVDGAKIGDTLNVRRPPRFVGSSGPNLSVEDYYQSSIPVVIGDTTKYGDQFHVDTAFTTKDLRLSLGDFSENVVVPAVAAIANKIDYVGMTMAKNSTANIVGTYGTAPTSLLTYLTAGAYLDSEAAPRDGKGRAVVVEQFTSAAIVDALKGLFVPNDKIAEQFRMGLMGTDSAGMNWKMGQNVNTQTSGSWSASSASTMTASTTSIGISTGWAATTDFTLTVGATMTLKKGDVISIANVFPVNPQNRQIYGTATRKFVVQSDLTITGSSTGTLTVAPAIITAGQFQNVSVTATSATATVTPYSMGVSGTGNQSPQNILFHKNAFTLAMADLPLPGGVVEASRASSKKAGMSIRIVRQYTINNDQIPARFDTLWGWAPLYQELACRIAA